jgi:MoaA/NifB/PqqE/SkfB family radical SAM enzyme
VPHKYVRFNRKGFFEGIKKNGNNIEKILKKYTFSRCLNLLALEVQKRVKPIKAFAFPRSVHIDITNICNSNCQLCPTGLKRRHRLGHMNFGEFRQIIDKIKHKIISVGLYVWGEPLLHKDIVKMVNYCTQCSVKTSISTNLNYYDEEVYKELFKAGLGKITCSLHGISQSSYEAYRPGYDYKKNIKNLNKITKLRKKMKAFNTEINLGFAVTAFNEHEVPLLDEFCISHNIDALRIIPASLNLRFLLKGKKLNDEESFNIIRTHVDKWQAKNPTYARPLYNKFYANPELLTANKLLQHCLDPWQTICINWEGEVTPCCGSYDYDRDTLGNVFETDIYKLWNNEKYINSRLRLKNKSFNENTLCSKCIGGGY